MLRNSDGDGSTDKKAAVARVRSAKMRSGNPESADDRMPRAGCSNGLDGLEISGVQGTLLRVCRLWESTCEGRTSTALWRSSLRNKWRPSCVEG